MTTPKIIPATAAASQWHNDAARIIHSREQNLNFGAGIKNNYSHSHRFRTYNAMTDEGMYHLHVLLSLAY